MTTSSDISILEKAQDRDYWQSLNPNLTVCKNSSWPISDFVTIESDLLQEILHSLKEEGYFQIDSLLPNPDISRMREGIENLRREGWPPAFAYMYDEFWQTFYRLSPILSAILGDYYRQIPDVWAWYIDTSKSEKGWEPHRDRKENSLLPDGMPKEVNIWIPLTDVTPLNGCMYVLPADLDPNYHEKGDTKPINPQDIRALPAPAGSIICWNPVLWHWGSRSSNKAKIPRISIACDFQQSEVEPYENPLLDPSVPLDFDRRLGLICKLLLRFRVRYKYPQEQVDLAVKLQKKAPIPYWIVGNSYRVLSDRWSSVAIPKGELVEIAHIYDDMKIMVRHPQQKGQLYPFQPLELVDAQFGSYE